MELIVHAPVFGQSGYEQLSRGLFLALDQMGVQISLKTDQAFNSERVGLSQSTIMRLSRMMEQQVSSLAPNVIYQLPKFQNSNPRAPTICYTLFETDRVPQPWIDSLMTMNKIFVFSEFNRLHWSRTGIPEDKIDRLPVAVDSFMYTPDGPRLDITNAKGYRFLMSGDFTERKNFEAVIEAYVKEFTESDDVTLVIKCHYGGFIKRYRRDCANRLRDIVRRFNPSNAPRILFWGDKISNHAMASLYRSSDCFVLASRGEGLGMQYLEAMASGLPVIHCNWSAHTDYLNEINSYPVQYQLKTIDDPNYIVKCPQALNSKWAQVDIADLQRTLRHVFENRDQAKKRGEIGMKWAREQTWQKMAIAFIANVVNMYSNRAPQPVENGELVNA